MAPLIILGRRPLLRRLCDTDSRRRGRRGIRFEFAQKDDGPRDRLDVLHVHLGVKVEPRIDGQHDDARQVETDARRHDGVGGRQVEGALRQEVGAGRRRIRPGERRRGGKVFRIFDRHLFVGRRRRRLVEVHGNGQETDEGRQEPDCRNR